MRTSTYPAHKVHHRSHPLAERTACQRFRSAWGVLEDTENWDLVTCRQCLAHRDRRQAVRRR
jgi:hypothetical protein